MTNILFVESGVFGGGSFESLYQYLMKIDRLNYTPYVVFTNKTKYFDKFSEIGVLCFVINDFLYTKHDNFILAIFAYGLQRIKLALNFLFPFPSLTIEKIFHFKSIRVISQIIKEHNIKLIHTNNQVNRDLYAIVAAQANRLPCVAHLRSFFSLGFNKVKARYVNNQVQKFIAYSHSIASFWINKGLHPEKVIIIYNAIECEQVPPLNLHQKYDLHHSTKLIGIVGRIIPVRGHLFLIEAIRELVKLNENFRLLVVGSGEYKLVDKLKRRIDRYNLSDYVIFTGSIDEAKHLIAGLDILVMPYSIEPFGRTLLEAWCLKTPVILTSVGHIKEIATDGKNAIFVDYGNIEQFSEKLNELLTNEELSKIIANNAQKTCLEKFSISYYKKQLDYIYRAVSSN